MGLSRPAGTAMEAMMYELCVGLGFCLAPDDEQLLRESPPEDIDAFTDAVLVAEGMDPLLADKHLRLQVRGVIAKWFARGAITGVRG
jgi:hypothetical protein